MFLLRKLVVLFACVAAVACLAVSANDVGEYDGEFADFADLMDKAETQRRQLQQTIDDLPGPITAPVGWLSGTICNAMPRTVYQEYMGMPWWAPMGIAQGICSNTITGTVLGMSI